MKKVSIADNDGEEKLLKIARAVDEFEVYASSHARRIAVLSDALARRFNFAAHDLYILRQAAFLHDIGEMTMNREYIKAERRLSDAERVDVERHPVIGEQEAAKRGLSRAVQLLVRWHHEQWNGGGYPDAIDREQIPLAARILRVSDTFAALTADRPHRRAIAAEEAKRHLTEGAGIEFDPKIVKIFLSLEELKES
ncbi:MAG TPA: HD domain-containing phosphohydrolase [Pyrinomonadaceae bacterium]|nr:HD domain-containing phosphohydrolase [Pyrinomonadaceae bacterium]